MGNFFGLEISKRAIMTHQTALLVTGHNIANADTEGYSRQIARMVTPYPWAAPSLNNASRVGQLGTGVEIASINRVRDQFLDSQLRNETRNKSYWSNMEETLGLVEVVINEPSDEGLRSLMDAYWSAWEDVSNRPEDESTRTVLVQSAQALSDTFNQTHQQLVDLRNDLNDTVAVKLEEVNSIARQIADLNQQILAITVSGQQPNDLMDKRDLLLDQLSSLGDITISDVDQGVQGSYNSFGQATSGGSAGLIAVQMAGRTLVQGTRYVELSTQKDSQGMYLPIWADNGMTAKFSGGEIGSLLNARGKTDLEGDTSSYAGLVPEMIENLNSLAKTLIVKTNELHRSGYSLNNDSTAGSAYPDGTNFFNEPVDGQAIEGQWARYMKVSSDIVSDAKNIAAAQYRTWDGTEGNMVQINFGDGTVALKIAQLKQSLNGTEHILNDVRVDVHSEDPLEFSFNKDGELVTVRVDAPYSYDEDLGKVASAIQEALDEEGLAIKVRCDGNDIVFYSETVEKIEYINPDSGILEINSSNLQDASYEIATDTGQPGANGAQLRLVQNYNQGTAANIFGSGVVGAITNGNNPVLSHTNASIELTVDSVDSVSGVVRYSYVSHEYDRDTGEHENLSGVFEVNYNGAANQQVTIGNVTFQLTNLDTKLEADVAELMAGDTGVLNLVAATAGATNYNQLGITYNNDGEDDFTQKFVFADNVLDGTGTEFRRMEFFTLDDQPTSSTYGTSYDGHLELRIKSLGTASPAAYFSYYAADERKNDQIVDVASGIKRVRAAGLAKGEYELSAEISQPGAANASIQLVRDSLQGGAPDILGGFSIAPQNLASDLNASMELRIESKAGTVVTYSYVSHEYQRSNGEYSEHTGSFSVDYASVIGQDVNIGSMTVTVTPPVPPPAPAEVVALVASLTVGDTGVLNQAAATMAGNTYQQLQIAYNSDEEAEMIQDFVFDNGALDNLSQVRMRFFAMNEGQAYDGYIDLQTGTLATSDPAVYINYQEGDAVDLVQKRSINPASGLQDIQYTNLQGGDYQIITANSPGAVRSLTIQQSYNQSSADNILGSAVIDPLTISPANLNASIQLEVTNVDLNPASPTYGQVDYSYVAHVYTTAGAYSQDSGNFSMQYGLLGAQTITLPTVAGNIVFDVNGLNLPAADARELVEGDKGVLNLTAAAALNDDVVTVLYNEGTPTQSQISFVFTDTVMTNRVIDLNFQTLDNNTVFDSTIRLDTGAFAAADPAARIRATEEGSEFIDTVSGILNFSARGMEENEYSVTTEGFNAAGSAAALNQQSQYLKGTAANIFGTGTTLANLTGANNVNASIAVEVVSVNKVTGEVRYSYKSRELESTTGIYSERKGEFSLAFGGTSPQTVTIGSITFEVNNLDLLHAEDAASLEFQDRTLFSVTPSLTGGMNYDRIDITSSPGSTDAMTTTFYVNDGFLNNLTGKELGFYTLNDETGAAYSPVLTLDTGVIPVGQQDALRFVYRNAGSYAAYIPEPDLDVDLLENVTMDEFWRSVASEVGVQSQEATRMVTNQTTLITELENKRQSISGVSLDEEMTEMIKLQHGYNASARMLTVVDEMIDVIINRMGRAGL